MGKQRRQFSEEFKQDAVNHYYTSNKSMEDVAKELKIGLSTLTRWIASAKTNNGTVNHRGSGNSGSDEEKEIKRLKKELRDTKDALGILKKAINILND